MTSSKQGNLTVKLTYTFRGEEQESKIFSAGQPAVLGLPANAVAAKVRNAERTNKRGPVRRLMFHCIDFSQPQAGDYSYAGMHDTGPLVPPLETTAALTAGGRPAAYLIASVQQAKEYNDSYLTQWIENEKMTASSPEKKRAKTKDREAHTKGFD